MLRGLIAFRVVYAETADSSSVDSLPVRALRLSLDLFNETFVLLSFLWLSISR